MCMAIRSQRYPTEGAQVSGMELLVFVSVEIKITVLGLVKGFNF